MTTPKRIQRRQRIENGFLALIAAVVIFLAIWQLAVVNPRTEDILSSLCALRADKQQQVTESQKFLDHPERFPDFNDPKILAATRVQLVRDEETLAALNILPCD